MTSKTARSLIVATAVTALAAFSAPAHAAEPYGTWLRPSTGTQVSFYKCSGKLCGKIVAVKDESRKKEVGTVIMKGAVSSGPNTWNGDLLDAESGKVYSGVVTLEGPNALNLKGCVAMVLCRGETWSRIN